MSWIIYAVATAVAIAIADFCVKLAAGKLSNSLGVLIYGCCTFLTGLGWVLIDWCKGAKLTASAAGIGAAAGVGIAFSIVTLGLYATFGAGAPISSASPLMRLGGLLLASALGFALLGEQLTGRYVMGVLLVLGGIYLIVNR